MRRLEIFDHARKHTLSAADCWLLVALTLMAEQRSMVFVGTITELHQETRLSRRVVAASLKTLADRKLVQINAEFGPGSYTQGEVQVMV